MTNGTSEAFRGMVDQLVEVGFEMIFYSFGSGFNPESEDILKYKEDFEYANSKGFDWVNYKALVLIMTFNNFE